MLNDQRTSELVSQSLSGRLSVREQQDIDAQLGKNQQSRNFAKLSKVIQESLSDIARKSAAGDESIAPGLSADSRERMKQILRAESARLSQQAQPNHMARTITADSSAVGEPETSQSDSAYAAFGKSSDIGTRRSTSRFTIIRKIGEGGLGTVWLARDEQLKRSIALKEMNSDAAEFPRAWERFHREAEITGHLEHPNVVPLYQFGTDADTGQPFYGMRFVGKRTLVDAIEEYHDRRKAGEDVTMDRHRLLTAFIGVCQAIAYAHSRGVVHRDLKPENVALDSFGQVIVLDWGLAKISDEYEAEGILSGDKLRSDSSFTRTQAGEIIGTPLYMAPEQAAGDLQAVDERTDVYGLGAILFAMMTGSAPHQNSSRTDAGPAPMAELLQKIAGQDSPRPRDYTTEIPSDLEAICMKCMRFKPHSRFQSATEVSDAVQQWMAGRSERRQAYANVRSEGRELRTSMLSSVRDLERNVRFMSALPPIQGIIDTLAGREGDNLATWRDRLAVIFNGLLRANCDFCAVSFAQVSSDTFKELVCVERQATEISNIRSIPASRLQSGPVTDCLKTALSGNPDEVHVALSSECGSAGPVKNRQTSKLLAVVPVFDAVTEELFGFTLIEANLDRLIETQTRERFNSTKRMFVLDNDCKILLQTTQDRGRIREHDGQMMSSLSECWSNILPTLKADGEFLDEQDHAMYATRIDLVPGKYSLALAMCLAEK